MPGREPLMSEEERKLLMLHAYKRQEQIKVSISHFFNFFINIFFRTSSKTKTKKTSQVLARSPLNDKLYNI